MVHSLKWTNGGLSLYLWVHYTSLQVEDPKKKEARQGCFKRVIYHPRCRISTSKPSASINNTSHPTKPVSSTKPFSLPLLARVGGKQLRGSCIFKRLANSWWCITYHIPPSVLLGSWKTILLEKLCEKTWERVFDGTKDKKYLRNPFPNVRASNVARSMRAPHPEPSSCEKGRNMGGLTQLPLQKVQHRHRQENADRTEITEITHHLSWVIGTCTLSCSSSRWCRYCNQSDSSWSPAKSSSQLKHSSSTPPRNWIQNGFING